MCVLLLHEPRPQDTPPGSQAARVQLREEAEGGGTFPRAGASFWLRNGGERHPVWRYWHITPQQAGLFMLIKGARFATHEMDQS